MVPFEPGGPVDLSGKRIFMANGTHDPLMSLENAKRLAEIFRTAGAEVEHLVVEAGHNLIQQDFEAARAWLTALP
jgi:phospholipase/carboxylesterase